MSFFFMVVKHIHQSQPIESKTKALFGIRKLNLLVACTLVYVGEYYWKIYFWKMGKSSFFKIVSEFRSFSKSHLTFCGKKNPPKNRSSRGDLKFQTLNLLSSEIMQIYNRGKPQVAPGSVCSAHSFSELLTPPVWWLSCLLGSRSLYPVLLRQCEMSTSLLWYVVHGLHTKVSVTHTVEEERGEQRDGSGNHDRCPRVDSPPCWLEPWTPGSWHSYRSASGSSNPDEKWYLEVFVLEI